MSLAIWKFPAMIEDEFTIAMDADAQILCVQVQRGVPCIWAIVSPKAKTVKRRFRWVGTGHALDDDYGVYVGSVQLALVFHLFAVYS